MRSRVLLTVGIAIAVIVALGATFSTGAFSSTERRDLRVMLDWYKRCVVADVPRCGPSNPPTTSTTAAPTTTTTRTPTTTTITAPSTTTTTVPAQTAMPTRANTGPSNIDGTMTAADFLRTGVCDHKRITDQVRDESGQMLGRTFTIDNCALDGGFYYVDYGRSDNFPTITIRRSSIVQTFFIFSPMRATIDHVYAEGGYWVPCAECGADDHQPNQTIRPMPITVTDSYFYAHLPPASSPYHSEALHVVGAGDGYRFTNTRFSQEGPNNGTQTAALKFTGRNAVFDHDYFDWAGTPAAAYYSMYFEGINVTVTACKASRGIPGGAYEFPDIWSAGNGYSVPPLQGCTDFDTGQPIS